MPSATTTTTSYPAAVGARGMMGALGAKITRVLSRDGTSNSSSSTVSRRSSSDSDGAESTIRKLSVAVNLPALAGIGRGRSDFTPSHSPVRGRDRDIISTGRGGAGNIHRSQSRGPISPASPVSPGRDPSLSRTDQQQAPPVTHVGRGGAGNIRDPSKPRELPVDPAEVIHEHEVIEHFDGSPHRFSTGRGGAGNIQVTDRSLSRERTQAQGQGQGGAMERSLSRGRPLHSTGRGGAGNITSDTLHEEEDDELERRAYSPHHPGELHSTGRGGLANVTTLNAPPVDDKYVYENGVSGVDGGAGVGVVSVGRGGAGNIHERRSASRGPGVPGAPRSQSRGRGTGEGPGSGSGSGPNGAGEQHQHQGTLGKLIDRVKHTHLAGHHEQGQTQTHTQAVERGRADVKAYPYPYPYPVEEAAPVENLPSAFGGAK